MIIPTMHIPRNSIRFKLVVGVLSIMVFLSALLTYNSFYAIKVVRNQVAESNQNLVSLYMKQIDNNLEDVDKYLASMAAFDLDLQIMESTTDADNYLLAKIRLIRRMSDDIHIYKSIDSFFIYSFPKQDLQLIYNEGGSFAERKSVQSYIRYVLSGNPNPKEIDTQNWYVRHIGADYYLFYILKFDSTYIGAYVNIKKLLIPLQLIDLGEKGTSIFATGHGEPMVNQKLVRDNQIDLNQDLHHYYLSGAKHRYLVVGEKSVEGNFSLIALIPDEKILEKLPYFQRFVTFISIGSFILLPLCLLFLRKNVLIPLNRIIAVMKLVGGGNLDVALDTDPTSEEFQIVNSTFNQMIAQIKQLRISIYEEQLNKQKEELRHLQLQVNPHFFMNSLNIIYSLAQVKKYELIQEMTLCLVRYFRYMFQSNNSTYVPLKEELQHIRNYLRIQELRLPNSLTYQITAPESLWDTLVPPLLIQSFVENTIKHAVTLDEPIQLSVWIGLDNGPLEPGIKIIIRDTGKGFTEKCLKEIRAGKRILDGQGEHIGIWNVQRRLHLLYGKRAYITYSNGKPGGAIIEMWLPLQPEKVEFE